MNPQLTMFDAQDQVKHLDRVRSKILKTVLNFCHACTLFNSRFTMSELVKECMASHNCSPDSPSRILRQAKREGLVDYEVVDRGKSMYRILKKGTG